MPASTFLTARNDLKFGDPCDGPIVLLSGVIQLFDFPHDDRYFTSGIDLIHGCLVGVAPVHRRLLGNTAGLHGLVKKAQG